MKRRNFLKWSSMMGALASLPGVPLAAGTITTPPPPAGDRAYWVSLMYRMASPILKNMSKGELKKNFPVEYSPSWDNRDNNVAYLEALGRLTAGITPWLALPDDATKEGAMRKELREQLLQSLRHSVDPASPDYLLWRTGGQPLVDAAFLVHGFLRAPQAIWEPLDSQTKERFVTELKSMRRMKTFSNNWVLFVAMVETFLYSIGEDHLMDRIDDAIAKTDSWYKGDGMYGDGPAFHYDYYNGYVIQPMYLDVLKVLAAKDTAKQQQYAIALKRMQRYGAILERQISPEGTYPIVGRSSTYRAGAFQPLAQLALNRELPAEITPAQVRCALTAVMKRQFEFKGTFSREGFLSLGVVGHQPEVADSYSNSGSMYLASLALLPLGLPATDPFWSAPYADWSMKRAWSGGDIVRDHAIRE
ncbi:DUF2264 domain-containing protein [Chitinophaga sp. XS-30]|nr:DUF2264 domain-containing protein [Chitinophaga sp. XS-30]